MDLKWEIRKRYKKNRFLFFALAIAAFIAISWFPRSVVFTIFELYEVDIEKYRLIISNVFQFWIIFWAFIVLVVLKLAREHPGMRL